MAKRYQPQALLAEQDGVQTFSGRDALNGLPVRLYSFMGEPTSTSVTLTSPHIPPLLEVTQANGAGEVVAAVSPDFRSLRGAVPPQQVEALLRHTTAALDEAARAGVVHGDLSPERVLFEPEAGFGEAGFGGRFLLEGYGVPWRVRPSEFSPPERIGGATFAGDIFSWAMTMRHLSGPLPGELRDLLARCLDADPAARPHAREVRAALESYPFGAGPTRPHRQAAPDQSAFETFAKSEPGGQQNEEDEDDLTPKETSGWHVPLRTPATPPLGTAPGTPPSESIGADLPSNVIQDSPRPAASQSGIPEPVVQETNLPPGTLRRVDGTSAYRERRERYTSGHPRSSQNEPQRAGVAGQQAVQDGASSTPSAPPLKPRERRGANPTDGRNPADTVTLEPVPGPDLEDDFEVIDDIDDRAPAPMRAPGGRRVLLLTLLIIAILVLAALNLFSL